MLSLNKKASCGTSRKVRRKDSWVMLLISWPLDVMALTEVEPFTVRSLDTVMVPVCVHVPVDDTVPSPLSVTEPPLESLNDPLPSLVSLKNAPDL